MIAVKFKNGDIVTLKPSSKFYYQCFQNGIRMNGKYSQSLYRNNWCLIKWSNNSSYGYPITDVIFPIDLIKKYNIKKYE